MKRSIFSLVLFIVAMLAAISYGSVGTFIETGSEVVQSISVDKAVSVDFGVAEINYEAHTLGCKSILTGSDRGISHDRFYVRSQKPDGLYSTNAFKTNKILFG